MAISVCVWVASATPILAADGTTTYDFPVLFLDVHGGAPQRLSGGATVLFGKSGRTVETKRAVEIQASAGMGGARVAGGAAFLNGPFGPDVLLTLTRTSASPRDAAPHATYAGLEAGYLWLFLKVSVGVAHRVAGPSGHHDTVFTWKAGAEVPLCAFTQRCSRGPRP